jgi:hypothetical protein
LKLSKSGSNSKRRQKYRLYRTLKRKPRFRNFQDNDIKYLWAAYKLQIDDKDITPEAFQYVTLETIDTTYDYAWILEAPTKTHDIFPVGIIFGVKNNTFVNISDIEWFPWASKRNIVEASLHFAAKVREQETVTIAVKMKDKNTMEHFTKYGIITRIGTLKGVFDNEPAPFYQTKYVK